MAYRDASRKSRSPARQSVWWVFIFSLIVVAILPLIPPSAAPIDLDPVAFSASRAYQHASAIAQRPHPLGSEESVAVRTYIVATMEELGWIVDTQSLLVDDYFGEPGKVVEAVNVVGRFDGVDSTGAILLVAHYDTHPETPGANDNSVAVASLLEVARALSVTPGLQNDVIMLFTDGEEPAPRYGVQAFIDQHSWFADVGFVVNLEASGSTGSSLLVESSGSEGWLLGGAADAEGNGSVYSLITGLSDAIGGFGTDFTAFKDRGVPGLSFAYSHGSPIYHTRFDTLSNIGMASMQHHGNRTLGLVNHFGDMPLDSRAATETWTFFTVFDHQTVRYPNDWALPVALIAVIGIGLLLGRSVRIGKFTDAIKGVGMAAFWVATMFIGSGAAWFGVARMRPFIGLWESYAWLTALASVAFLAGRWALDRVVRSGFMVGLITVGGLVALGTAILIPGASYLFAIPCVAMVLHAIARSSRLAHRAGLLSLTGALVMGTTILLGMPAIDVFWQFGQPRSGNPDSELLPVAAIAVVMVAGTALFATWVRPGPRLDSGPATLSPDRQTGAGAESSLAPGVQPYDTLNGVRIGAFSGGILGALPSFALGSGAAWMMVAGALGGGAVGYLVARREIRRSVEAPTDAVRYVRDQSQEATRDTDRRSPKTE